MASSRMSTISLPARAWRLATGLTVDPDADLHLVVADIEQRRAANGGVQDEGDAHRPTLAITSHRPHAFLERTALSQSPRRP
jgi:hypothetical protein